MPTSQNPAIRQILGLSDPREQARQLAAFIQRGEDAITEARTLRNELIRKLWKARSEPTIDALAAALGVNRYVVIDANRKK